MSTTSAGVLTVLAQIYVGGANGRMMAFNTRDGEGTGDFAVDKGLASRSDDRPARYAAVISQEEAAAGHLDQMLENLPERVRLGQNAQRRVHEEFLIFDQIRYWLELLSERLDP